MTPSTSAAPTRATGFPSTLRPVAAGKRGAPHCRPSRLGYPQGAGAVHPPSADRESARVSAGVAGASRTCRFTACTRPGGATQVRPRPLTPPPHSNSRIAQLLTTHRHPQVIRRAPALFLWPSTPLPAANCGDLSTSLVGGSLTRQCCPARPEICSSVSSRNAASFRASCLVRSSPLGTRP